MKRGAFLVLVTGSLLAACDKEEMEEDIVAARAEPYISEWSSGSNWARQDSAGFRTFSFTQTIEPLNDAVSAKGTVLVFARGMVQPSSFGVAAPSLTQGMPFDAYPDADRRYRQSWYFTHRTSSVEVRYTTNEESVVGSDALPSGDMRFRYFVFPEGYLQSKGLTAAEVRRLNYDALCTLCRVSG